MTKGLKHDVQSTQPFTCGAGQPAVVSCRLDLIELLVPVRPGAADREPSQAQGPVRVACRLHGGYDWWPNLAAIH